MTHTTVRNFLNKISPGKTSDVLINLLLILGLSLSISLLMTLAVDQLPKNSAVGAVAAKDLKADRNYEIVDEKSSAKLKQEAIDDIRPVYDFDSSVQAGVREKIRQAFDGARLFLAENSLFERDSRLLSDQLEAQLRREFQERLGGVIPDDHYSLLRAGLFSSVFEKAIDVLVTQAMQTPLVHNKQDLVSLVEKGFILRKLMPVEPYAEETLHSLEGIMDLDSARENIALLNIDSLRRDWSLAGLDREGWRAAKLLANNLIRVNMNYNGQETEARRQKASANVKDVIIKIKRGESVIRSGDRFEAWHLTVIEGIRKARLQTSRTLKFFGFFIFVNLILLIVYSYASKYIRKFNPSRKDLIFLGTTLIFFIALLRIGVFVTTSIRDAFPFPVGITMLYYALPVAAGAMLVRFMLNSETALVFAVISSLFSGIFLENNLEMTTYYLVSGVFAAHVIAHVDKRSTVLLCGAYLGLVNVLAVTSLNLISQISTSGNVDMLQVGLNALSGFSSGIFTAMTVLALAPLAENIFNYTTDIKLLELSSLSHPLLKEMIVKAPGTYHHSQIVGVLAEAAAQAIGANPLLARVACYYHDIGKMKKPQYFIENQSGENPHDRLNPSMSALIIGAHISDGMDMAREHKLPQKIADMIPQHQGTKVMGFFYDKAKKMADPELPEPDERDYRYKGPKPQTREAGIIMMADTIEAFVRTLPDKTPQKIQAAVEKLVNQHFLDEQLDECDLTLRDLHRIAGAFVKILIGIYHQRVEYPEGSLVPGFQVPAAEKQAGGYGSLYQQASQPPSNISPLFKKKGKKGS